VKIVPAKLGDRAGVIGAALMAFDLLGEQRESAGD
jgi:hypothetical protein